MVLCVLLLVQLLLAPVTVCWRTCLLSFEAWCILFPFLTVVARRVSADRKVVGDDVRCPWRSRRMKREVVFLCLLRPLWSVTHRLRSRWVLCLLVAHLMPSVLRWCIGQSPPFPVLMRLSPRWCITIWVSRLLDGSMPCEKCRLLSSLRSVANDLAQLLRGAVARKSPRRKRGVSRCMRCACRSLMVHPLMAGVMPRVLLMMSTLKWCGNAGRGGSMLCRRWTFLFRPV